MPNASPAADAVPVRFRDRVRARTGVAELLAFRLGAERFAFDLRAVDEIVEDATISPVPDGSEPLAGACTVQGRAIPVFAPGRLLGVQRTRADTVLVMRSGDRRVGLLVDEVHDVELVDLASLRDPPFDSADDLLLGVLWRDGVLTSILDARALLMASSNAAQGSVA